MEHSVFAKMAQNSVSKSKAMEILRDGTVNGKPLTKKQRELAEILWGCENSLEKFSLQFFGGPNARFSRDFSVQHGKFFEVWDDPKEQKILVVAHRGWGKTSLFTYAAPAQAIMFDKYKFGSAIKEILPSVRFPGLAFVDINAGTNKDKIKNSEDELVTEITEIGTQYRTTVHLMKRDGMFFPFVFDPRTKWPDIKVSTLQELYNFLIGETSKRRIELFEPDKIKVKEIVKNFLSKREFEKNEILKISFGRKPVEISNTRGH